VNGGYLGKVSEVDWSPEIVFQPSFPSRTNNLNQVFGDPDPWGMRKKAALLQQKVEFAGKSAEDDDDDWEKVDGEFEKVDGKWDKVDADWEEI
jgi:hypothetical protein